MDWSSGGCFLRHWTFISRGDYRERPEWWWRDQDGGVLPHIHQITTQPKKLSISLLGLLNAQSPFDLQLREVRPAGLEPATHGLEIRCSIQLSYGRKLLTLNHLHSVNFC